MKDKLLTSNVIEDIYYVLGKRPVKAVDEDCLLMNGIEFTLAGSLSEDHIHYVINKYDNVLIYKRDKIHCIAVFPRSLNLLYGIL